MGVAEGVMVGAEGVVAGAGIAEVRPGEEV